MTGVIEARTSVVLADGRELFYFDDEPGHDRTASDTRSLHRPAGGAELRYDRLTGEPVLVAAHRQTRTVSAAGGDCPLCPSRPGHPTEIPAGDYHVAVFENRFPSLGGPVGGRCEVVSFSSDHDRSFASLSDARWLTIGRAWADRTAALSAVPGVEQVFVFENRGAEVGATLSHPHGQIYAYPYLPPVQAAVLRTARAHRGCLLCSIVEEQVAGPLVVAETEGFVAFVPVAARWPYEVHIVPRGCVPYLTDLDDDDLAELMCLYGDVLRRFEDLFGDGETAYMACWHQPPLNQTDLAHFYVQVFTTRRSADRWKFLASSESGAGAFINDVRPEAAAERLRNVPKPEPR
ncbi:galactose-1-phosphate uridylyltransferase [Actinomadura sp. NPDC048394]|uniref:galactose-1-phosphate uridylyltransferase n=1 Tax=Actinomadura sp. NPDC048394 TaxID=3158223 RepID=UPI0033E169C6